MTCHLAHLGLSLATKVQSSRCRSLARKKRSERDTRGTKLRLTRGDNKLQAVPGPLRAGTLMPCGLLRTPASCRAPTARRTLIVSAGAAAALGTAVAVAGAACAAPRIWWNILVFCGRVWGRCKSRPTHGLRVPRIPRNALAAELLNSNLGVASSAWNADPHSLR
jgi:hypothetical protein